MNYYRENAEEFIKNTLDVDMSDLYAVFEKHLKPAAKILDVGCGPGRDLKYFNEKYQMAEGIEPSKELCEFARDHAKASVFLGTLMEFETKAKFDGIWACASLLHIPSSELSYAFQKIEQLLHDKGVLYCSFKYGEFEGDRNGRTFTDLTEESLPKYLNDTNLKIEEYWITHDVRPGRENERWLNAILLKGL